MTGAAAGADGAAPPLAVEGLVNARDLGGLPIAGGGTTPAGVFVRSERPDLVTAAGWDALREHGVRTVVDLRYDAERLEQPAAPAAGLTGLQVDLNGPGAEAFWDDVIARDLMGSPVVYGAHLRRFPERLAAVLAAIADAPPGGVLFHCAAGRDRTGTVAAVLLRIAGVEPAAIEADWSRSVANGPALAAAQSRPDAEPDIAAAAALRGAELRAEFRDFAAAIEVDRLLELLSPAQAQTLRSWRGALPIAADDRPA